MEKVSSKIKLHQRILSEYLEDYARIRNDVPPSTLEYQVLIDIERGHFQVTRLGWHERRYYFMVLFHLDIKEDGKIWIQQNNTEVLIAEELVAKGIHKSDIVLGFRPDYMRPASGFAAA
jgi:hypothetical protein